MSHSISRHKRITLKSIGALAANALLASVTSSALAQAAPAESQAVLQYAQQQEIFQPQRATGGMVSSDHFLASQVGAEVLRQGGNAIDAAVATGFTLAVVLPYAGNLGGGGFMLWHMNQTNTTEALDFREVAPQAASVQWFLDDQGQAVRQYAIESTASIGVPGTVAGLLRALDLHGSMPREALMAPAIELAQNGFDVTPTLARLLNTHQDHLYKSLPNRSIFFTPIDGVTCAVATCTREQLRPLRAGERLVQADLAQTLRLIAKHGVAGFYEGAVAQAIVQTVAADRGKITLDDLATYRTQLREPVWGQYRDVRLASMPAPSSGGIHLIQMLNMLEHWPVKADGWGSAANLHRFAEVAKLAYADRATHLGDPDFYPVPSAQLISPEYARARRALISATQATPSIDIQAGQARAHEPTETTHFSVADRHGNLVATTTTLNLNFGSGWMAQGTGVLLNNEMDDFAIKPGVPNAFGLIGSKANALEPGKRPLSSMTPTLLFKDGQPWIATGSPGGSRIITIVLQVITNVVDFDMNIAAASAMPRMHHQWLPDTLWLEQGFSPDTIAILQAMGHQVLPSRAAGRVQSVAIEGQEQLGAHDPRSHDGAAIGVMESFQ